jgi:ribosome maturation factor RimP
MQDVVGRVRDIAGRVAADRGLEIFDVQFRREAPGMVLRIQIDRPGPAATAEDSVSVEDCAHVSRELSAMLRRLDDYRRFAGRVAKIVMRVKVDGQGFFRGKLGGLDGTDVLIEADDRKTHRVPFDVITRANLEVEF